MEYTAYKFQPSFIEERLKSYKSNLMKFKGHDDLVGNAVRVIRERLESDPRRYLSYGPYWWAIKKVLVDNGVPLGKVDDEEVRLAYTGTTDEETIVMAEEFRNDCLGNMKLYTDRFMRDEESGRWWRLRGSRHGRGERHGCAGHHRLHARVLTQAPPRGLRQMRAPCTTGARGRSAHRTVEWRLSC